MERQKHFVYQNLVWVLLICVFGVRELLQGGARPPVFEKKIFHESETEKFAQFISRSLSIFLKFPKLTELYHCAKFCNSNSH